MPSKETINLSVDLQDIASDLSNMIKAAAGRELPFVLVIQTDDTTQYVANGNRADSVAVLEELLIRWRLNKADIPAHYNPDLKGT